MGILYKSIEVQNKLGSNNLVTNKLGSNNLVLVLKQDSMEYKIKNVFGLRWNCRDRETEVFQVSNDDTVVMLASGSKMVGGTRTLKRRYKHVCLVKGRRKMSHLGLRWECNITGNTRDLVKRVQEGNVVMVKRRKKYMKANLEKLLKYKAWL
ncbi:hypothetical protein Tco_0400257 [Tanacetum coccineum]